MPRFSIRHACAGLLLLALPAVAQTGRIYTADDYSHAAGLLRANTVSLVDHAVEKATFLDNDRFWYVDWDHGIPVVTIASATQHTHQAAWDAAGMAAALHAAGLTEQDPRRIYPDDLKLLDPSGLANSRLANQQAQITIDQKRFLCRLKPPYQCSVALQQPAQAPHSSLSDASLAEFSPDGRRAVFIRNWNLWVRDLTTGVEKPLTTDGVKDYGYATDNAGWTHSDHAIVVWSPDSQKIATFQQDQRRVGEMYTLTSRIGHPKLETWKYPLVGDADVTMIERVIIDVATGKMTRLGMPPDQHRSTICDHLICSGTWEDVQWADDGKTLAFVSTSRNHKVTTVRMAEVGTGAVRTVFTEAVSTFFESGYQHANWRYLSRRNEILWFSQRQNWGNCICMTQSPGR